MEGWDGIPGNNMISPPRADPDPVDLAAKGDREALAAIVEKHLPLLLGFLRYLGATPVQAEDLAQETLLKMSLNLSKYDKNRPFLKWLTAIARNVFIDFYRKEKKEKDGLAQEMALAARETKSAPEKYSTVDELLENLDDDARFLIEMHIIQEYKFAEIAEMTGEAEGTLRVRFHRLMNRLRLEAKGKEEHDSEAL